MSETVSTSEIIERLASQAGIRKKLAAQVLHAIPDIIEEGLKRDGEARVRGLGTFRMKWTQTRIGRNPKTGVTVEIPPHDRIVFLPEQSLKDYLNEDFRLLTYQVIPAAEPALPEANIAEEQIPASQEELPKEIPEEPEKTFEEIPEPIILTPSWPEPVPEPEPYVVAGIGSEEEPGPAERRRRMHWIIPVVIAVIVILAGIFYLRNFRHEPVGGQRSEVEGQRSEVEGQRSEVKGQKSEVGGQRSEVEGQKSEVEGQESEVEGQRSEVGGQESENLINNSKFITSGIHLFQVSRDVYDGNPYLWALIYKANREVITDPQNVPKGLELEIPGLEGTPHKLSHNDSLQVSEGYRLLAEYYREKDAALSEGLLRTSKQFSPK